MGCEKLSFVKLRHRDAHLGEYATNVAALHGLGINVSTKEDKMPRKRIITALLTGYICAIAWTVYADIVYHNHVPLDDLVFSGLYPISIGLCVILTAFYYDRNLRRLEAAILGRRMARLLWSRSNNPGYLVYQVGVKQAVLGHYKLPLTR